MRGQDTQLPGPGHRVLLCCCTGCSPHGHSGPRAGPRLKRLLAGGHTALSVVGGKQPHKESPLKKGEGSEKGQAVGIGGHHLPRTAGGWDEPAGWGPGVLGISLECPQGAAAGRGRGRCWGVASPLAPLPACWWPRLGGLGSPRWGREWAPSEAGRPCPSPGPPPSEQGRLILGHRPLWDGGGGRGRAPWGAGSRGRGGRSGREAPTTRTICRFCPAVRGLTRRASAHLVPSSHRDPVASVCSGGGAGARERKGGGCVGTSRDRHRDRGKRHRRGRTQERDTGGGTRQALPVPLPPAPASGHRGRWIRRGPGRAAGSQAETKVPLESSS